MLYRCSSCRFQSHNLDELKSHHAKEHMQKEDVTAGRPASTIKARNAPLEVILLDSDDDESEVDSDEEGSIRSWRGDSGEDFPDETSKKRKSTPKKQSPHKKRLVSREDEERRKNKEKIEENERREQQRKEEGRKRNKDEVKRIFQEAERKEVSERKQKEQKQRAEENRSLEEVEMRLAKKEKKKKKKDEEDRIRAEDNRKKIGEDAERRKKAQEDTKRLVDESMKRKVEKEYNKRALVTLNLYEEEVQRKKAKAEEERIGEEKRKRHNTEAKKKKARDEIDMQIAEDKKRKAEEGAKRKAAAELEWSEQRGRMELAFYCSTCDTQVPDKHAFQIHLFGRHGDLWCEKCNFVGNIATMTAHLPEVHGYTIKPSYSVMIEWNGQNTQDSNGLGLMSMSSPAKPASTSSTTSSSSSGTGSISPVRISLNPKTTVPIGINEQGRLVQCRQCPFKTDNLVELNCHEEDAHKDQPRVHQPRQPQQLPPPIRPAPPPQPLRPPQPPQPLRPHQPSQQQKPPPLPSHTHSWLCPYCLFQVDSQGLLKSHIKLCPDRKKDEGNVMVVYVCPFCDRSVVDKEQLKSHILGRAEIKCTVKNCTFVACSAIDHREHQKLNHWQCKQCDFSTTLKVNFATHFLSKHAKKTEITNKPKNTVPQRPLAYQISDLKKMPIIASSTSMPPVFSAPAAQPPPTPFVYARKSSPTVAVQNSQNYIVPAAPRAQEKSATNIVCPVCHAIFANNNLWFSHITTVHPTNVTSVCHLCHRGFEDAVALKAHFGIHHNREDIQKNSSIILKEMQTKIVLRDGLANISHVGKKTIFVSSGPVATPTTPPTTTTTKVLPPVVNKVAQSSVLSNPSLVRIQPLYPIAILPDGVQTVNYDNNDDDISVVYDNILS